MVASWIDEPHGGTRYLQKESCLDLCRQTIRKPTRRQRCTARGFNLPREVGRFRLGVRFDFRETLLEGGAFEVGVVIGKVSNFAAQLARRETEFDQSPLELVEENLFAHSIE